ncbi:hypothetical protein NQ314_020741 [Rhamnusium bicolor]|uniref:Trafficking protein particle complex subunit 8 n=1 Tax=Rhamnusium bicolor TaxID=1586634 RepID=A0AAV8WJE7_9CUCU|nr:hypothetical protein NQ314_020741 [Rhamnusium bicolor]
MPEINMAQCKQSPQEFIKNAFTPQVAVMCTPLAEKCCQKNNLDFIELLQPFSRLNNDVHYKDPTGLTISIRNLKVTFLDITWRPPQTPLARKLLNSSVSGAPESRNKIFQVGKYKLDIPSSTPWFESWRDTFLRVQYPSDHEFTKHFLACILVVSSSDNTPAETFVHLTQSLNQLQSTMPGKLPKWFSSNILKYYVIVHDNVEGDGVVILKKLKIMIQIRPNALHSKSAREAEEVKNVLNYHPLSPVNEDLSLGDLINEEDKPKNPAKQQPHGNCLSTEDVEQVKLLIYEFTRSCLLPYIEKQIVILNDIVSNKKGMSKSLFSATKRWFSPNKPGASSVAVNNLIYSPDSPELQIRRLGDLYFMFGHYSSAFQAYHLAKRDYNMDQAWLYYAGALEMAALSAFMANESNRKTCDYMEESITTYLNTCKMPQFATRATILSTECLKHQNVFGDAAHQLIRMTSEESDLRSALLLEQAAYCFLQSKMIRKYAFHMVLAGHRFSKAAQRKHSLKCYKQAYQIYENTGWDLASDHIHYTIGRQANNLQHFDEAVDSFSKLLNGGSKQSAQQQAMFLKEYLTILGNKLKTESEADQLTNPILPVPELDSNSLKILVGPTRPLSTPGKIPAMGINFNSTNDPNTESRWNKLEEMLIQEAEGSLPMVFKPLITLYTINKLEKSKPIAVVSEPIQISLQLVNSLQTALHLKDIYLLWSFDSENEVISNEILDNKIDDYVKTYVTKTITMEGNSKQDLVLSLTPLLVGMITINGFCYTLTGSNAPTDTSFIKGKQLINIPESNTKLNNQNNCNNNSKSQLEIKIVPPAPCLQFEKNHITSVPLTGNVLEPGQTTTFNIWVKAPNSKGPNAIDLLIYYENIDKISIPRYRLIRHSWNLTVQESVAVDVSSQASHNSKMVEELALAMKITNLNKVHNSVLTEVMLLNVGLLSKNWSLTKDIVTPKYINLHSQESAHILLKAKRAVKSASEYSSIPLNSDKKSIQSLTNTYLAFAKKAESPLLNIFDDFDCVNYKENKDGILLLQWKALVIDANNKRVVNGQCHIPIEVNRKEEDVLQLERILSDTVIDINDKTVMEEERIEIAQKQVSYNLVCPSIVQHNFAKQKLCIVPIKLLLHSIIDNKDLSVVVNTCEESVQSSINKSNLFYTYASSSFSWLGNSKIIKTLKPLSTDTVDLSVVFSGPGTYNLGANIQVSCSKLNQTEPYVLQSCQIHSALIVVNIDS